MSVGEFLASLPGAITLTVCIAGCAAFWISKLIWAITSSRHEVSSARSRLAVIELDDFAEQYEILNGWVEELPRLSDPWRKYAMTLILPKPGDEMRVVRSTFDPRLFFDAEAVVGQSINLRWFRSVPNILTGMGLLGTFIGLVAGIFLAKEGLVANDLQAMQAGLARLLGGAYSAFFTSIAGILSSMLFTRIEKGFLRSFDNRVESLCRELDRRIPRVTVEHLLVESVEEQRRQSAMLKTFNTDLAMSIAEALDGKLEERLGPSVARLVEAVEGLRFDQNSSSQTAIEKLIAQFQSTLSGAAGQELHALSDTLKELTVGVESIVRMLDETQAGVRQELESSLGLLREGVHDLAAEFRASEAEASELRRREAEELRTTIHALIEQMQRHTAQIVDSFQSAGSRLQSEIDVASDGFVERIQLSGEEIVRTAAAARSELEAASQAFHGAVTDLNRTIVGFGRVMEAGQRAGAHGVRGLQELLDTLAGTLNAADRVQAGISAAMSELAASSETIGRLGERMDTSLQHMQLASDRFERVAHSMELQAETFTNAWNEQRARFEGLDVQLVSAFEQIRLGIDSYMERMQSFLVEVEKHTGQIAGTLSGAVNELRETVEEMGEQWRAS